MSQVLRRARWRASNSGLRIDAACLTAEIMAGPRSAAVTGESGRKVGPDDRRGTRHNLEEVGNCSRRTSWPILGIGSRRLRAATSPRDSRAMLDK